MAGVHIGMHLVRGALPPARIQDLDFNLVDGFALPELERREARKDLVVHNSAATAIPVSIDSAPCPCDPTRTVVSYVETLSATTSVFGAYLPKIGGWYILHPDTYTPHIEALVRDAATWSRLEAAEDDRRAKYKNAVAAAIKEGRLHQVTGLPTGDDTDANAYPQPAAMVYERGHKVEGSLRCVRRVDAPPPDVRWPDPKQAAVADRTKADDRQATMIAQAVASGVAQALAAQASQQAVAAQKAGKP